MIDLLNEFCCVARHLNITHAAAELNMSQPNLSRHLRQLERDLGFTLFERKGGHLALTNASRKLADDYPRIRSELDNLLAECKAIDQAKPRRYLVHDAPYMDEVIAPYQALLKQVGGKSARFEYRILSRISLIEAILNHQLDIGIIYVFSEDELLDEESISTVFLSDVPLAAFVNVDSDLVGKSTLSFDDIAEARILMPNDSYHPIRSALDRMFAHFGGIARYEVVNTSSRTEFMSIARPDCIFVYPASHARNPYLAVRDDLVCVPLDESMSLHAYAFCRKEDGLF